MKGMEDEIEKKLEEIMEENNIGYRKLSSILNQVGEKSLKEGKNFMTDEEYERCKEFAKKGNEELELAVETHLLTNTFAYGLQATNIVFGDIDFSQPFRIVIDYDPEQLRTIVKKYLTKEALQLYIEKVQGKAKD